MPSVFAGICVLLIFTTEGFDFVLGVAAAILGLVGAGLALRRDVRGGMISTFSVVIGLASLVISVFQVLL